MANGSDSIHDLSDAEWHSMMMIMHQAYPEIVDASGGFIHRAVILNEEQRLARDDADATARLQDRARAFAQSLIDAMTAAERVTCAAPARYVKRPMKRGEFIVRHPEYIETRHGPFLECDRNFGERARSLGFSANYGATVRAELILLHLLRSEVPPWTAVLDARLITAPEDEGQILAAIYPLINDAHEADLKQAESNKITRAPFSSLRSKKAKLAAEMWSALSDAKLASNHMALRSLFKVMKRVVEACRAEALT